MQEIGFSEEPSHRLEQAVRSSILALAHAPQTSPSGSGSASFDLRAVFRSLGATGQPEVLRTPDLQKALVRVSIDANTAAGGSLLGTDVDSFQAGDNDTTAANAAKVAARLVGGEDKDSGGLDYRRFENWLMPPRVFTELRGVLIELVEEGSALGLKPAELFLQFGGNGNDVCAAGAASKGIGSHELREGLAALSVHLTETEVETVMTQAGCVGGDATHDRRLTLDMFTALVKHLPGELPRGPPAATAGKEVNDSAETTAAVVVHTEPAGVDCCRPIPAQLQDEDSPVQDGLVTPDSLAPVLSPRISLSELASAEGGTAGGPGTALSSAVAHVEAFGRVAADVQAVLTSAVSSGTGNNDGCDGKVNIRLKGRSNRDSDTTGRSSLSPANVCVTSGQATAATNREAKRTGATEAVKQTPTRLAASASGPVPRTRAITPPLGPARSPSEPLHPTRASRERLEAALETLDLKERLRPTVAGEDHTSVRRSATGSGGRLPAGGGEGSVFLQNENRSTEDVSAAAAGAAGAGAGAMSRRTSLPGSRRPAKGADARPAASSFNRTPANRDGTGGGGRVSTAGMREAGAGERGRRSRWAVGYLVGKKNGNRNRQQGVVGLEQRRLGSSIDDSDGGGDVEYADRSRAAPEVIGRLRARVAELELTEQVSICCGVGNWSIPFSVDFARPYVVRLCTAVVFCVAFCSGFQRLVAAAVRGLGCLLARPKQCGEPSARNIKLGDNFDIFRGVGSTHRKSVDTHAPLRTLPHRQYTDVHCTCGRNDSIYLIVGRPATMKASTCTTTIDYLLFLCDQTHEPPRIHDATCRTSIATTVSCPNSFNSLTLLLPLNQTGWVRSSFDASWKERGPTLRRRRG